MSKSRSKKEPVTDVKKMSFRERNRLSGGYLLKSTRSLFFDPAADP